MKIGIIGYGKLGKEIERLALERSWEVVFKQDSLGILPGPGNVDAVIHAARPEAVLEHTLEWAKRKTQIVIATTGWAKQLDAVRRTVHKHRIGLVHANNFSVGVQVFYRLLKQAGDLMNRLPQYDVSVLEAHHKDKVDAPSGTALQAGALLLSSIKRKKELLTQAPSGRIKPSQLQISSIRAGSTAGEHTVVFDSPADRIEIRHSAKDRSGFANGALLAAEWIQGKRGVFMMDDVLAELFEQNVSKR